MVESVLIFVVEDEGVIRDLLVHTLEEGGFAVAQASTAEQAIQMLEENRGSDAKYRALVTDVNLGKNQKTGWDVSKRAREINDKLPVIYMTGGNAHEWAANGVPNSVLLTKPFAPAQVVTAVSQLINLGNTPGA